MRADGRRRSVDFGVSIGRPGVGLTDDCRQWRFTIEALPPFASMLVVLALITYFPQLVLWLPNLLMH